MTDRPLGLLVLVLCFLSICFSSAAAQGSPNQGYGTILGTVVDPMGVGIPGARITAVENSYKRIFDVTTDCSGFYRLLDLPTGSYTVRFGKQAFSVETRTSVLISPSAVTQLDVKMQLGQFVDWGPTIETSSGPSRIGSIAGTVTDGGGAPIPGAHVKVIDEKTGDAAETTTNANGRYILSGVGQNTYTVRVEAQGFKTETKRSVLVGAGASIDIRLSVGEYSGPIVTPEPVAEEDSRRTGTGPAGAIQGTVIDATGAVPTRISAVDEATGKHFETTTDSNGAYHFRDLPAGTYCAKFEAWAAQWKAQPEEVRPTFQTSKEVRVEPSRVSELNVSLPAPRTVIVEVCSSSCVIQTGGVRASPPKIALQLYAPSNVVRAGNQLWITTTLTNISRHAVFIRAQSGRTATVDYQIYADGKCGCLGPLRKRDSDFTSQSEHLAWLSQWRKMRIRPGKTVIDRVDLSKLLDLRGPGIHTVTVEYAEGLVAMKGKEIKYPPVTVSNSITVVVTADSP
jgi:hypothetical protein